MKLSKKGNLIPVYREMTADLETPVSAFLKIRGGDYSYLLESVEGGERIARYSFMGSDPSLVFKSRDNRVEIIGTGGKKKILTTGNPVNEIKKLMEGFSFVKVAGLPRFCGGLVGYLGYDVVRFFEKLPEFTEDDLRLPDSIFVLTDTIIIFDHVKHKIKIVACAHTEDSTFFRDGRRKTGQHSGGRKDVSRAYSEALRKIDRIVVRLQKPLAHTGVHHRRPSAEKKLRVNSNFTPRKFKQCVKRIKKYIRAGDIVQAVFSQRFETELKAPPINVYRALRSINPSPFMYYIDFKGICLVGSSPELLVRCEDRLVETRPIAGTRGRGKDEDGDRVLMEDLLSDPKERAEHIMLVDLGRNDLGRVCEYGSVSLPEFMVIEKYSHVMHIVSSVTGKLARGKTGFDVIRAAFPAGTVTGAPKIRAMEIIEELEGTRRGPYAGCIGYLSFSGNLDTCITIRTIVIKGKRAYVQAGAGIVAYSDPEKEYRETVNKARGMLKALEIAQRGLE